MREQPEPVLARTFHFRLSGSEEQHQVVVLPAHTAKMCVAATRNVRVYLTGNSDASVPLSGIGGVEVELAVCDGNLTCAASIADFRGGDLVVVQVDVAVYAVS